MFAFRGPSSLLRSLKGSCEPDPPSCRASPQEEQEQGKLPYKEPIHLPTEIVLEIFSYLLLRSATQRDLHACSLVCRQWYDASVPLLYRRPVITSRNFDHFIRTVCPSINAHIRRSPLAELVRTLDLSRIIHSSSKSLTARLLGRLKDNLEVFIAPQSSFAINAFAALSKCNKLRELDLYLVSEAIPFHSLAHVLRNLSQLRFFRFPRSSSDAYQYTECEQMKWPSKLEKIGFCGGTHGMFLRRLAFNPHIFPPTLHSLVFEDCPKLDVDDLKALLCALSPQLRSLRFQHLPRLGYNDLDDTIFLCPNVTSLTVSLDYISYLFSLPPHATGDPDEDLAVGTNKLRHLRLTNSGNLHPDFDERLSALELGLLVCKRQLPELGRVEIALSLGWDAEGDAADSMGYLIDRLVDLHEEKWENRQPPFEHVPPGQKFPRRECMGGKLDAPKVLYFSD